MRGPRSARRVAACVVAHATLSLGFLALMLPGARGDEAVARAWDTLAQPVAAPDALAASLPALAAALDRGGDGTTSGNLTLFDREEEGRFDRRRALEALEARALDTLRAAGLAVPRTPPALAVLRVRVAGGLPSVLESPDGAVLLLREPRVAPAGPPPAPVRRTRRDGPPPAREAAAEALEACQWLRELGAHASARGGPGSLAHAFARRALRAAALPEGAPAWLRRGLEAWLEERLSPTAAQAPLHVCARWAGLRSGSAAALLGIQEVANDAAARLLGRALGRVLEGRTDLGVLVEKASAPGLGGDAAWSAAFGSAPAAALGPLLAAGPRPPCDAAGRIPCPACAGQGRREVACEACSGLGQVACASCGGGAYCRVPGCLQGWHPVGGDREVECLGCAGTGSFLCLHCSGKVRQPCRLCSASGRRVLPCLLCKGRRTVPCPEAGGEPASGGPARCAWCEGAGVLGACGECRATGWARCGTCYGEGLILCLTCRGSGCGRCGSTGRNLCEDCSGKRRRCDPCAGKGTQDLSAPGCAGCEGTGLATGAAPAARTTLGPDEQAALGAVRERAVAYLLTHLSPKGGFALREFRAQPADQAGILGKAIPFANAMALWTLSAAGLTPSDPRVAGAWSRLRADADVLLGEPAEEVGVQECALVLRALVADRGEAGGGRVQGLVDLLVKGQRPGGLWGRVLADKDAGEEFSALFALESLFLAQRAGARVPASVWDRAFQGASKSTGMLSKSKRRGAFMTATDVASVAALLVLSRAGREPKRSFTQEELTGIPGVQRSLDWLERHADLTRETIVAQGVVERNESDASSYAWLYAAQRLGQLLSLERLGGRAWYAEGARHLRQAQLHDGSFEELRLQRLNGPLRATCCALLFLTRATPSVTAPR